VAHGSVCRYACAPGYARLAPDDEESGAAAQTWQTVFELRCDGTQDVDSRRWLGKETGCVPRKTDCSAMDDVSAARS
jgi:hypothetical protein